MKTDMIRKDEIFVLTSDFGECDYIIAVCKSTQDLNLHELVKEYDTYCRRNFNLREEAYLVDLPWIVPHFSEWVTIIKGYAIKIEACQLCVDTRLTNGNPISLAVFPFWTARPAPIRNAPRS